MNLDDIQNWTVTAKLNDKVVWQEELSGNGTHRVVLASAMNSAVLEKALTQEQVDQADWTVAIEPVGNHRSPLRP